MKWLIRLGVVFAAVVLIAAFAIFFSLNSIAKKGVETVGPMVTKTEVKLHGANLSPFSGKGQLTGFVVANPPGYQAPSAIEVGDVKVNVNVKSVFSDVVLVETIDIRSPEITFEGGFTDNNLKTLLNNVSGGEPATESPTPSSGSTEAGKKLKVASLRIQGAKVRVNLKGGVVAKTSTISIPDIHLVNIGMDQNGVSSAELSRQVMHEILKGIGKSMPEVAVNLTGNSKSLGNQVSNNVKKSIKDLKNLFRK